MKPTPLLIYPIIVAAIIVLIIAAFNPGCMNEDTFDHWDQAISHKFRDWHPVGLTLIWAGLRYIYDGPQAVLVLQLLLFSIGLLLIVRVCQNLLCTVALFAITALVPPVFVWLGVIGKDAFMAAVLVLAIGLYYSYSQRRTSILFWLALIALYLAYAVRHNAVFAVVPLLLLLLLERFRAARAVLLVAASLLCFAGLERLTRVAFKVDHYYPEQGVVMFDLAALSLASGAVLVPPEFHTPQTSLPAIQRALQPWNGGYLFWGSGSVFRFSSDPEAIYHLKRTWIAAVVRHPAAYMRWRLRPFYVLLAVSTPVLQPYIHDCVFGPNERQATARKTRFHEWVMGVLQDIGQSIFFRPYVYLIVLLVFVAVGFWLKRLDIILIASSGLFYAAAYFVIGMTSVFRFVCFSVFVAIVLLARVFAEMLRGKLSGTNVVTAPENRSS